MMRLIDADAVIRCECGQCDGHCNTFDGEECLKCTSHNKCKLREAIDDAPSVDAEPVRHAEWIPWEINGKETKLFMTCSGCKRYQWPRSEVPLFRRCPKCGARMDGGNRMRSCDKCIHYDVCFIAKGLLVYETPKNSDAMDCDYYLEKDLLRRSDMDAQETTL